jgi:hypothetical protein
MGFLAFNKLCKKLLDNGTDLAGLFVMVRRGFCVSLWLSNTNCTIDIFDGNRCKNCSKKADR